MKIEKGYSESNLTKSVRQLANCSQNLKVGVEYGDCKQVLRDCLKSQF